MGHEIEEFYLKYKDNIYNYLYQLSLNKLTAEELTQDTFFKAFKYFNSFKAQSTVKTWLYKIARNTYLDYINKKCLYNEETIEENEFVAKNDDYSNLNEKIVINGILNNLTEAERTLILLRDLYGFSYVEISTIIELTIGQVKIGIYRARKKFKQLYNIECEVLKD
jgi:RNA polymerase sigma-70 factor, ECF subfamily